MNERYSGGKDLILDLPESHDVYNIKYLTVTLPKFRVHLGNVNITNVSDRIAPYVPLQKRVSLKTYSNVVSALSNISFKQVF